VTTENIVNHYLFNITGNSTLTSTLVWERQLEQSTVNNLWLFLYNATNGTLEASSVSTVDNVQHVYIPHLPPGKYDLEVVTYGANSVTLSETYALAFQFYSMSAPTLTISVSGGVDTVSWPWSPTVYILQQTSSLSAPISWSNVTSPEWITNDVVLTTVTNSASTAFFRLVR
jgi:hypothetical protein